MRRLLDRIRIWRILACYREIAKLEVKMHNQLEAAELRTDFLADSFRRIDNAQKAKGLNRNQRRTFKRKIVNATISR